MKLDQFLEYVKPYTMTSDERIGCLFNSLEYINQNNINGDYVECGVWKGGIIMGHDYTNHMFPEVVKSVNEFCDNFDLKISFLTEDGCPTYAIFRE